MIAQEVMEERGRRPFFAAPCKDGGFGVYMDADELHEVNLAPGEERVVFCGEATSRRAAFKAAMALIRATWRVRNRKEVGS